MPDLTNDQRLTLEWLAKEDSSAYGECRGPALDALRDLGLVAFDTSTGRPPEDYCSVTVTDAGRAALAAN